MRLTTLVHTGLHRLMPNHQSPQVARTQLALFESVFEQELGHRKHCIEHASATMQEILMMVHHHSRNSLPGHNTLRSDRVLPQAHPVQAGNDVIQGASLAARTPFEAS